MNPGYNLPPGQRTTQRLVDQFNADERLWKKLGPRRGSPQTPAHAALKANPQKRHVMPSAVEHTTQEAAQGNRGYPCGLCLIYANPFRGHCSPRASPVSSTG
jgi:hypothetical protein